MSSGAITLDLSVPAIEIFWDADNTQADTYSSALFGSVSSGADNGYQISCNFEIVISAPPTEVQESSKKNVIPTPFDIDEYSEQESQESQKEIEVEVQKKEVNIEDATSKDSGTDAQKSVEQEAQKSSASI